MNLFAQEQAAGQVNAFSSFIPLILIIFVFYFLLIRPQQKRDKEHKKLLSELKKDDYVLTSCGIYGTIISVKPDTVELKVDENTKITFLKSSVIQVIRKGSETKESSIS